MQWRWRWCVGCVDWHAVQLQSTAELVSRVSGVYPDWCRVQAVSTVESTGSPATVGLTYRPSASVTTTRHGIGRVRRTSTDQSTVRRSATSLTQSAERRRRLYCSLCRVKLNADQQAEQHYRGKLHARKSRTLTTLNSQTAAQNLPVDTQVWRDPDISPGHTPQTYPAFLHGVGHFPLPPPPSACRCTI